MCFSNLTGQKRCLTLSVGLWGGPIWVISVRSWNISDSTLALYSWSSIISSSRARMLERSSTPATAKECKPMYPVR
ncbi:UNVERIFIED_CONTAM: hypothetical protein NCL1_14113 [Trichonephila clavipes]